MNVERGDVDLDELGDVGRQTLDLHFADDRLEDAAFGATPLALPMKCSGTLTRRRVRSTS